MVCTPSQSCLNICAGQSTCYPKNNAGGIVDFLALNPRAGVLIKGTGGIRKMRWGRGGKGKQGGARIIYFFHDKDIPLYLLTVFGKGDKDNLSKSERNGLAKLVRLIVASWREKHE